MGPMRILIVANDESVAKAYAEKRGLDDYKWIYWFSDLEDEENVGVVFTGEHYSIVDWQPIRDRIEEMVRSGLAEWYW